MGSACMGSVAAVRPAVADISVEMPTVVGKEAFRCFFLTVHAKKDAKPGVHRGEVVAKGEDGQRIGSIPVAIRVLDFALPRWSNIKFDILRRRAEYVRERLMK